MALDSNFWLSFPCQIALTRQSILVTTCDPFHMHHLPGGTYQCPHSIFHLPISDLGVRRLESAQARHTCDEENNFEAWTATSWEHHPENIYIYNYIYISIWVCLKIGYIPNYSHLIGIMISKTIGFRGTLFSDKPIYIYIYIGIYIYISI